MKNTNVTKDIKIGDIFYRVQDRRVAPIDEFDPVSYPEVNINKYVVTKITPKGVWIIPIYGDVVEPLNYGNYIISSKFVLLTATKKFACPTLKLAMESFLARKYKQIKIYSTRIKYIKDSLHILDRLARKHGIDIKVKSLTNKDFVLS